MKKLEWGSLIQTVLFVVVFSKCNLLEKHCQPVSLETWRSQVKCRRCLWCYWHCIMINLWNSSISVFETWLQHLYIWLSSMDMIITIFFCVIGGQYIKLWGSILNWNWRRLVALECKMTVTIDSWEAKCNCLLSCEIIAII